METKIQINDVSSPITMNAGFIIVAVSNYTDKDGTQTVLGVRPNLCEYVTWLRVRENEYYHGHYFRKFRDAVKDFRVRV